ncbi:lysophospholipid acyltransferase family protein [Mucilaginibacter paludis]|uniref:Lipid A biosynthesis acyltransferase n=1 Tax=Mucilaginibacter paludis DSM 18603 TaxID=714943 RepID=H1YIE7_9SPHI|nr:lysophospholipid acyltransferase family protein [Mucilaginibacter paludis]EHQ27560.1 lipid A biosynthesis acyltransferase [Mucilaginibacter paludis DSM 18603]
MKRVFSILLLALLFLLSISPFWLLYIIADVLYIVLYYIVNYRRKVVDLNLLNAFPEKSAKERALIRKKYFRYLADLVVETVKLLTISHRQIAKRVFAPNPELIQEIFNKGQSVIGILGHYGNWEMNGLRFSQLYDEQRVIVYKPMSNIYFDTAFIRMRSRFGATLVSMKNTARKLVEYRNERSVTVLVGDQTPARSEIQYFTNFLNQPTAVFLGVEKLAKLTNTAVVFCDIRRVKRGYYQCAFIPLYLEPKLSAIHEITNAHVQYLEQRIRQELQYWLWSHRRWKFKPEDITENGY